MRIKLMKKELLFPTEHNYFNACHSSTLTMAPNGELLAVYFAGEREGLPDTGIWLSRCSEGRWGQPQRILYDGTPHWNPVIFTAGETVYVFYKIGENTNVWKTWFVESSDSGHSWSERRLLCPDDPCSRGPVRNKLILGRDGSWIAPGSVETSVHFDSFVEKSFDNGKSWQRHDIPISHRRGSKVYARDVWEGLLHGQLWENDFSAMERWDGIIQPTLWYSQDGMLHAFMRSTRGHIYRSDSSDDGQNWCEAYETIHPNNNAGIDVVKLSDGKLILACNPVFGCWARRTPLSLLVSEDDGETFPVSLPLETLEGELSYPSVNYFNDRIHVTFTYLRRSIMHCECEIAE